MILDSTENCFKRRRREKSVTTQQQFLLLFHQLAQLCQHMFQPIFFFFKGIICRQVSIRTETKTQQQEASSPKEILLKIFWQVMRVLLSSFLKSFVNVYYFRKLFTLKLLAIKGKKKLSLSSLEHELLNKTEADNSNRMRKKSVIL